MPTPPERQQMIATLREFPSKLEKLVQPLTDRELDKPAGDGDWTVRQVVHHLADSHMNSFIRLKLMLTEDKPTLKPYQQEAWAMLPDTKDLPVQSSLLILKGLHERWVRLFERLAEDEWSRPGYHPEIGEIKAEDLLVIYARHCEEHTEQIMNLLD
jgi:hypothetical protein